MEERTVVLIGELGGGSGAVADVIRGCGLEPVVVAGWREVLGREGVLAALFPATMRGYEEMCVELRGEPAFEDLPLVAVVADPWEASLGRLFMFSIDDFVDAAAPESLAPKLVALASGEPYRDTMRFTGRVVVADPDRARRVLYGRLLRRKGLNVDFAVTAAEVVALADRDDALRFVLAAAGLPPSGAGAAWSAARASGGRAGAVPWLVSGTAAEVEGIGSELEGDIRGFEVGSPPENVLFLVNEALSPPPKNVRASPRLLYGAVASFRVPGETRPVPAFSYNINRTGLYLRTLAPPPVGTELALELRPPHGEGRAAVRARVVWRKEPRASAGPVVPAGMGVVYLRVPLADGAALDAGYGALLEASGIAEDQDGQG